MPKYITNMVSKQKTRMKAKVGGIEKELESMKSRLDGFDRRLEEMNNNR